MIKKALTAALILSSALAHSSPVDTQVITDLIVATFNANTQRLSKPAIFSDTEKFSPLDSQGHLKAKLGSTNLGAEDEASLNFKDNKSLAYVVEKSLLGELTENGEVRTIADGSLLMTAEAKSRLAFGAVNMTGIVEARTVIIKNGVIILSGR